MERQQVIYKKLSPTDSALLTGLVTVYAEVFETKNFSMPDSVYLRRLLDSENIVFCVALSSNVVISGLTAYLLPSVYYPSGQVYLYDLAVKQNRQRQGIGKNLITFLKTIP